MSRPPTPPAAAAAAGAAVLCFLGEAAAGAAPSARFLGAGCAAGCASGPGGRPGCGCCGCWLAAGLRGGGSSWEHLARSSCSVQRSAGPTLLGGTVRGACPCVQRRCVVCCAGAAQVPPPPTHTRMPNVSRWGMVDSKHTCTAARPALLAPEPQRLAPQAQLLRALHRDTVVAEHGHELARMHPLHMTLLQHGCGGRGPPPGCSHRHHWAALGAEFHTASSGAASADPPAGARHVYTCAQGRQGGCQPGPCSHAAAAQPPRPPSAA
jgi:hypothetical protein